MDQNEAIFARYMNDENFKKIVAEWLTREIYARLSENKSDVAYQRRK
jgi:type I restriction enzyme R subunit